MIAIPSQRKHFLLMLINEHQQYEVQFGEEYDRQWYDYLIRHADGRLISPNVLTQAFSKFISKQNPFSRFTALLRQYLVRQWH